jgi:toluene monooxygenase system protein E
MKVTSGEPRRPRATLKTYWHLAAQRRIPSEYEIATSRLFYHAQKGFEVAVPLAPFYERYQRGSSFQCDDWDKFADPRQTTYANYTARASERVAFVGRLFERIEQTGYDAALGPDAIRLLSTLWLPLRYPIHALHMAAAYVGQMAPAGRITIACAFQAADEMRRIQTIAYRMAQLRRVQPGLGDSARDDWERAPRWQPLRRLVETLLVTWDWGEAFAALDLCIKPLFDPLVHEQLGARALAHGDYLYGEIAASLDEDARWHREWSAALAGHAIAQRPAMREVLAAHVARWREPALAAVDALAAELGDAAATASAAVRAQAAAHLAAIGIGT